MSIDVSLDKAEQSRFGIHKASWQEAGSWLGPLMEYARISSGRESRQPGDLDNSTFRRFSFFKWEVESLFPKYVRSERQGLEILNEIFFTDLGFRTSTPPSSFENALAQRAGSPTLLAMIYSWVAERFVSFSQKADSDLDFLRIELIHGAPHSVVRLLPTKAFGPVQLVDLAKKGALVDEDEWTLWCGASGTKGFERKTWSQGLVQALSELFAALDPGPSSKAESLEAQLYILDQIMALEPSDTRRWADRAILNTRRGDRATALRDLKRFFAFHEMETAPPAIVRLYEDLR